VQRAPVASPRLVGRYRNGSGLRGLPGHPRGAGWRAWWEGGRGKDGTELLLAQLRCLRAEGVKTSSPSPATRLVLPRVNPLPDHQPDHDRCDLPQKLQAHEEHCHGSDLNQVHKRLLLRNGCHAPGRQWYPPSGSGGKGKAHEPLSPAIPVLVWLPVQSHRPGPTSCALVCERVWARPSLPAVARLRACRCFGSSPRRKASSCASECDRPCPPTAPPPAH